MKPLLHPSTGKAVGHFIAQPAHALLLSGQAGAGKGMIAAYVVKALLQMPGNIEAYPFVKWLKDRESISIDDIRAIQRFMQLKVPGNQPLRRAIIIENVEAMSIEAQNAFLKLLEEPPADTLIVLTSAHTQQLLPTILSRLQHIKVQALERHTFEDYFSSTHDMAAIERAYYLSDGYMGLADALLNQKDEHPLAAQIEVAKAILSSTKFKRLSMVDEIAKQKSLGLCLQALERVCHAALSQAVQKNSSSISAWKERLQAVLAAQQLQQRNPQAKLLLTDLFLSL
jgi:DNA polymerase III delta prime subunit